MPRKRDEKIHRERTEQILAAARSVFGQRGFAEARMDDIADEAGISKGTLYLYFKSKQDIISGLLVATFEVFREGTTALLEDDRPVHDILLSYTRQTAIYMQEDASISNIAYDYYAAAARQPEMKAFLRDYFRDYRTILTKILNKGIEQGEYTPFDTGEAATLLIAQLEGLTLLWFTDPETVHLERLSIRAINTFFDGLTHKDVGEDA